MCLKNIRNRKKLAELKQILPNVFPVWKVLTKDMRCEFDLDKTEAEFTHEGVFEAHNRCAYRLDAEYNPGFHAFLKQRDAEEYLLWRSSYPGATGPDYCVYKFWAHREWVTAAGDDRSCGKPCVVLSKIELWNAVAEVKGGTK